MEPGDKQFRTDAFNAEQSQQANASRERGAAALGQGIAQGAQSFAQGMRWQQEFAASERARAFQQQVELQKLEMDRMSNQVHMSVVETQRQEAAQRLQMVQAMMANGSVEMDLEAKKLALKQQKFQFENLQKEAQRREEGQLPITDRLMPYLGKAIGDTVYVPSGGMAIPRKATKEEMARAQEEEKRKLLNDRGDLFASILKSVENDPKAMSLSFDEKMARVTRIVNEQYPGTFGVEDQRSGPTQAQPPVTTPQPSPKTPTSAAPTFQEQKRQQDRYQFASALEYPPATYDQAGGLVQTPITFSTLFRNGEPDWKLISEIDASVKALDRGDGPMKLRSTRSYVQPNELMRRIDAATTWYRKAQEHAAANKQKVNVDGLRVAINAILHGLNPEQVLGR